MRTKTRANFLMSGHAAFRRALITLSSSTLPTLPSIHMPAKFRPLLSASRLHDLIRMPSSCNKPRPFSPASIGREIGETIGPNLRDSVESHLEYALPHTL